MTPPSEEAILFDIEKTRELGFNMSRKHVKVESRRWYYHADRLGLAVIQDAVSGGTGISNPTLNVLGGIPGIGETTPPGLTGGRFGTAPIPAGISRRSCTR